MAKKYAKTARWSDSFVEVTFAYSIADQGGGVSRATCTSTHRFLCDNSRHDEDVDNIQTEYSFTVWEDPPNGPVDDIHHITTYPGCNIDVAGETEYDHDDLTRDDPNIDGNTFTFSFDMQDGVTYWMSGYTWLQLPGEDLRIEAESGRFHD